MLEYAVNSKVKSKIVKFLSMHDGEYHVSDLARILSISKSRASETLRELESMGVLSGRMSGRNVLYKFSSNALAKKLQESINTENLVLESIENEVIKETRWLKPISIVRFGSSLAGIKFGSDVDFVVIVKKDRGKNGKIYEIISRLSMKFGVHVSIMPIEVGKFRKNARGGDEFALNLMAGKLVDGTNLEEIVWHVK